MLRLKVSYRHSKELDAFLKLLPNDIVVSSRVPKRYSGDYKKAYIEIEIGGSEMRRPR